MLALIAISFAARRVSVFSDNQLMEFATVMLPACDPDDPVVTRTLPASSALCRADTVRTESSVVASVPAMLPPVDAIVRL